MSINKFVSSKAWVIKTLMDEAQEYGECASDRNNEGAKHMLKSLEDSCVEAAELLEFLLAMRNDLSMRYDYVSPKINLMDDGGIDASKFTDLTELVRKHFI
jgi:hypothetical protein